MLVIVGIIAVLVALLLPAVEKVRVASDRTRCANNLKQAALAMHNYHDQYKKFPPGYDSELDLNGDDTGPGWGWAAHILPYLEQDALARKIHRSKPIEAAENAAARTTQIPVFLCPADKPPATYMASRRSNSGAVVTKICEVAAANYVGISGISEPGIDGEGVLFRNSEIRNQDITDGTSHTLMFGERAFDDGTTTWTGAVTNASTVSNAGSPVTRQVLNSACSVLARSGEAIEGPAVPKLPSHLSSRHTGGVSAAFCDGHVRNLSRTVSYEVYKALTTRAGKDAVGEEF